MPITTIANGEGGTSVRAKLNEAIDASNTLVGRAVPQVSGSGPIIDDRWNLLGGGPAVYVPAGLFMPNVFQAALTADTKLTAHAKVAVTPTDQSVSIYFDKTDGVVKVAAFPAIMPADPTRYFHLVTFYGGQRGYSSDLKVESARSVRCVAAASFRPFLFDLDRQALYIPPIAGFTSDGGGWKLDPSDPAKTYREVFVPRIPADTSVRYIWIDIADILKNGTTSATALRVTSGYNSATNPLPSGEGFTVLLGTIFNEMFTPAPGIHLPVARTVANQCGVGRDDNDAARFRFGSTRPVALKRSESLALGFTRGYAASAPSGSVYRTFYGDLFDQPLKAGVFYARFYLETDIANQFDTTGIMGFSIDEGGASIGATGVNANVVNKISDYVREYEGWFRLAWAANTAHVGCWVGFDRPDQDVCRMFGLQFAATAENIPYISRLDYPRKRNTLGNRLAALEASGATGEAIFEPVIPDRLYVMDGRPLTVFPDQMLDGVSSRGRYRLVVSSAPVGGDFKAPINLVRDGGDGLSIRAEDLRSETVAFDFVDARGNSGVRKGKNVAIKKVTAANLNGLTKRILAIGDSITDWNGTIVRSVRRLNSLGATITTIGTLDMGGFIAGDAPLKGEGRGGKEFSDYINMDTDKMTPVAVGGEAAYLALGSGTEEMRNKNPFLRAATGNDPSDRVFNGHIFDMRFYLDRFGFADPDAVYIALGTNDMSQAANLALARSQIVAGVRVMRAQTRLALPSAKIVFGWHSLGRDPNGDVRWRDMHLVCLREVLAYLRTVADANAFILPAYCTVSRDTGFPVTEATDSASGLITRSREDIIHYAPPGTDQFAETGAVTLGGILAGI